VAEDLTFAQLRAFVHAARAESFAQAAERLDISQPSISELIKLLEERLGRRLFLRRKGARSRLTEDGVEVLEQADKILETYNGLFRREPKPPARTTIRISMGPYLRAAYLKPLVPRLAREYPDVEIDVQPMHWATDAVRLIESGALDLALYENPPQGPVQPDAKVYDFPLVLVGAPGTRARLSAGELTLDDCQFLFPLTRDYGERWAERRLRDVGINPRVDLLFVEFADILAQMVEAGQGIGYLTYQSVADRIADGRLEALSPLIEPMRRVITLSATAPDVTRVIERWLHEALAESNRRWTRCRSTITTDCLAS
jgi:DNA-binding transcriptional LysR family regulator